LAYDFDAHPTKIIPVEILTEVARLQEEENWIEMVPAYAELMRPGKPSLWTPCQRLTVADTEQLVEQHTRMARKSIERWKRTGSPRTLETAARHILRGRTYRCLYIELTGQQNATEADMPIPLA
jgi:hypothetical protein